MEATQKTTKRQQELLNLRLLFQKIHLYFSLGNIIQKTRLRGILLVISLTMNILSLMMALLSKHYLIKEK